MYLLYILLNNVLNIELCRHMSKLNFKDGKIENSYIDY